MPWLNIIAIIDLNTSFYVGFAFIKSEQEGDFTWALHVMSWLANEARTLLRLPLFRPNPLSKDSVC